MRTKFIGMVFPIIIVAPEVREPKGSLTLPPFHMGATHGATHGSKTRGNTWGNTWEQHIGQHTMLF